MNTVRSTWLGWGTLCVAGGGAYYFAKRQINADKQARFQNEMEKKARLARLESTGYARSEPTSAPKKKQDKTGETSTESSAHNVRGLDHAGSSSSEVSVAPVGHAPVDTDQRTRERSKYEAAEPYRSKKGDRFS